MEKVSCFYKHKTTLTAQILCSFSNGMFLTLVCLAEQLLLPAPVVLLLPVAPMATHTGTEQGEGGEEGHMRGLAKLLLSKIRRDGHICLFLLLLFKGNIKSCFELYKDTFKEPLLSLFNSLS